MGGDNSMLDKMVKLTRRVFRFKESAALLFLVLTFLVFTILNPLFINISNLLTIFTTGAEIGILALGVNLVMIGGEFDLSVGSIYVLSAILFETLTSKGILPIFSLAIVVIYAIIQGFFNGFITTRGKIPSFITTLGMQWFLRGFALFISGGLFVLLTKGKNLLDIFNAPLPVRWNIRLGTLWFFVIAFVFYIIIENTQFGNRLMASGGSPATADALGVASWKYKTIAFVIAALTAALGGLMAFDRFASIDVSFGVELELQAITACVIGGTLMSGGYGSSVGAFLGAITLSSLYNGLILAGAPTYWYQAFIGVILIIAGLFNVKAKSALTGG
jgi:simple sugar transport system permease protein